MFQQEIKDCLKKVVKDEICLEVPSDPFLGDFAFPCFQLAKKLKKSPADIAKDIAKKISIPNVVEKVVPNGPYLNFFLDDSKITNIVISKVLKEKNKYGSEDLGKGSTVVIDYSSPNIGKPFHIGHLRSTIIGNSLKLIHQFLNYKVVGVNHLGDWGTQFGKLIYAHLNWGNNEELEKHPTKYLLDLYVRFNKELQERPELQEEAKKWFKKLEDNDKKAIELWNKFKAESIKEFNRIYDLLNVTFDSHAGESFYNDKLQSALDFVKKKGLLEKSEGALVVQTKEGDPPFMLVKNDGASTYALRDLAALLFRIKTYTPKEILYVVGSEQNLHFKQLFAVAEKLGLKVGLKHVAFGLYLDSQGKKFASRKGKILLLDEVIASTIDKAFDIIQEKNPLLPDKQKVAHLVGVGAIIFGDLMNDRIKDVIFDWDRILDFEGDTGPYLQYTHARASSILRKSKEVGIKISEEFDSSALSVPVERLLIRILMSFPEVVKESCQQLKPHVIAQYALSLARHFNEFYQTCPCIKEHDKKIQIARLNLVKASKQVLFNSLRLLGITPLSEM